jgi:hypothetical protein
MDSLLFTLPYNLILRQQHRRETLFFAAREI